MPPLKGQKYVLKWMQIYMKIPSVPGKILALYGPANTFRIENMLATYQSTIECTSFHKALPGGIVMVIITINELSYFFFIY